MTATKRALLIAALVASVVAFIASAAVAIAVVNRTPNRSAMMGGNDSHGWGHGGSMMGSMDAVWLPGDGAAVSSLGAARARAAMAAEPLNLRTGEVIQFDNGFYVELKDATGGPATEALVDPDTGAVGTEPGPAMMWNTRIGMMRVGNGRGRHLDAAQAGETATTWLRENKPGTTVRSIDTYPGYLTLDVQRNGAVVGMMSVDDSGAVWYHTWHGAFIAMQDN